MSDAPEPSRPALDREMLSAALLTPSGPLARLDVVERSGSTNSELIAAARADPSAYPVPALLVADHQEAGRGRAGRVWQTPARAALTWSLLVEPGVPAERLPWLPLLVGLGVVRALAAATGLEPALKWPNDVLLPAVDGTVEEGWGAYRKAAGILVEGMPSPVGSAGARPVAARVVIGVGLNVTQRLGELPVPSATSLALSGSATTDRGALLEALVGEVVTVLDVWREAGGDARSARLGGTSLAAAVEHACISVGSRVAVDLVDGSAFAGRAHGLGPDGELLVRTDDGAERTVVSGDVRHVRAGSRLP